MSDMRAMNHSASTKLISPPRALREGATVCMKGSGVLKYTVLVAFYCVASGPMMAVTGALDMLEPGCWYEVPDTKLQSVFPDPPPLGATGPRSVMDAWSGGAYDTARGRLLIWGGGHTDYAGNEIYAFGIDTLKWSRLTEPTPNNLVVADRARYRDGRPSSRHTYNSIQYLPGQDLLVAPGFAAPYGNRPESVSGNKVDVYSFRTGAWEIRADKPSNGNLYGAFSAYDPVNRRLYHHGVASSNSSLTAYDPVNDLWEPTLGDYDTGVYMTAAVDPDSRIMAATGGAKSEVVWWDLNNPGPPTVQQTLGRAVDKVLEGAKAPGFVYDEVAKTFVGWHGGESVYTLNPMTWEWSKIAPAPGNKVAPKAPNVNGTYGRFRYIPPPANAFILVNRTNENVYFYKLTSTNESASSSCPAEAVDTDEDGGDDGGNGGNGETDGAGAGALDATTLVVLVLMLLASRRATLST